MQLKMYTVCVVLLMSHQQYTHFEIRYLCSLDPRPIRLQLNARSPPRPGIDCIWACIWACAVVAQVFAQNERIPEQGGANRNTNSVTYSVNHR